MHLAAPVRHFAGADDGIYTPVAALEQNARFAGEDQVERRVFVEAGDQRYAFQGKAFSIGTVSGAAGMPVMWPTDGAISIYVPEPFAVVQGVTRPRAEAQYHGHFARFREE